MIPGFKDSELLPEPEDPRMLSIIDEKAEGYPAEAYGLPPERDPQAWKDADAVKPKRPRRLPWGVWLVTGLVIVILVTYSSIVGFIDEFVPDSEWAYESTGIRSLNGEGWYGSGIRVCIVDTGIEVTHPDLISVNLVGFKDFIDGTEGAPHDNDVSQSHGTMMAGILVANGTFQGAAPRVQLIVAAALGSDGASGSEGAVADAITWCWAEMGAPIISLSLGGKPDIISTFGGRTEAAVEDALDNGVFVVAAAGNHGGLGQDYPDVSVPSNVEGVISVGAVHRNGTLWAQSSGGSATDAAGDVREWPNQKPEIVAPGVDIHSTFYSERTGPTWSRSDGTSDATVFVTAALCLILQKYQGNPGMEQSHAGDRAPLELVKAALAKSASPALFQEAGTHHLRYGYGSLDADAWADEVGEALASVE